MQTNVKVLGWIYIILGVLGVLVAGCVFISVFGGGLISGDRTAITVTGIVAVCVSSFIMLLSLPGVIAGLGLLSFQPWARVLGIILGVLNLFNFPIGTVFGIYALYVLLDSETSRLFQRQY